MKIVSVDTRVEQIPLSRPYTITRGTITAIETAIVRLHDDRGRVGMGAASPAPGVTGETAAACQRALDPAALDWVVGRDLQALPDLTRSIGRRLSATPAAAAALDMAAHDLLAQGLGVPLCDLLGRAHHTLPTSITIGIKPVDEALLESDEYLGRGFRVLKVKIGRALDEDIERLRRLRDRVGPQVGLRADANQGYTVEETARFLADTASLGLELCEQPVPVALTPALAALPEALRARLAADEALQTPEQA